MNHRGKQIADWLRTRVTTAGARGLVVGLSGGLDSAVAARLCQMATPGHVIGVVMPCHSDPQDEADAQLVADHFGIPARRIDLEPTYAQFVADLRRAFPIASVENDFSEEFNSRTRLPLANLKPRLRMATLYYVANSLNYLVAGTGNRSNVTIGYFTKYGDGGVDLLPLGTLLKSEVKVLGEELGVPSPILAKAASAGLWMGQVDEDEIGFSYADLERYLIRGPDGVAPAVALRLERMIRATEHKRGMAPTPE
jgi:NAD+ synthase